MKHDITNRKDIEWLVDSFYEKLLKDESIGIFFKKVSPVDLEVHLPIMYSFFENLLFYTGAYAGNPMLVHMKVHALKAFKTSDFEIWLLLFNQTIDALFEGQNAIIVKNRIKSIAMVMQYKIIGEKPNSNIM